jgi:hypothetical protein
MSPEMLGACCGGDTEVLGANTFGDGVEHAGHPGIPHGQEGWPSPPQSGGNGAIVGADVACSVTELQSSACASMMSRNNAASPSVD